MWPPIIVPFIAAPPIDDFDCDCQFGETTHFVVPTPSGLIEVRHGRRDEPPTLDEIWHVIELERRRRHDDRRN